MSLDFEMLHPVVSYNSCFSCDILKFQSKPNYLNVLNEAMNELKNLLPCYMFKGRSFIVPTLTGLLWSV